MIGDRGVHHSRETRVKRKTPGVVRTSRSLAASALYADDQRSKMSNGTKVAKLAFGMGGGFTKFEGSIQVIDNETSAVLYAYNVKKGNFQSAAEAFAKHFKDDYLVKR
jgi:hypothetical protein